MIYLVDSNNRGLGIHNKRYQEFLFDQSTQPYYDNARNNATRLEKESILFALSKFRFTEYDYVYKVTGKYFIPNFNVLTKIKPGARFILQRQKPFGPIASINSELVGFKTDILYDTIYNIPDHVSFEDYLYSIIYLSCQRLPKLKLNDTTPRGDGSILTSL